MEKRAVSTQTSFEAKLQDRAFKYAHTFPFEKIPTFFLNMESADISNISPKYVGYFSATASQIGLEFYTAILKALRARPSRRHGWFNADFTPEAFAGRQFECEEHVKCKKEQWAISFLFDAKKRAK
jgi:hypothetical protein